jgi:hypothetical protein
LESFAFSSSAHPPALRSWAPLQVRRQAFRHAEFRDADRLPRVAQCVLGHNRVLRHYRIGFDGKGLTRLTHGDGNHEAAYSSDHKQFVDTWSRVDLATVCELHSVGDPEKFDIVERGDLEPLRKAGWRPPEIFTAGA